VYGPAMLRARVRRASRRGDGVYDFAAFVSRVAYENRDFVCNREYENCYAINPTRKYGLFP